MPAATTKSALIAACEAEYAKLVALLDRIEDATGTTPQEDGLSIKDIVAHRAHWIDLWLGWEADGRQGRPVHMPEKGVKWSELKAYNAKLRTTYADLTWDEACDLLALRHTALIARLSKMSEDDLYGHPMTGGNGKWTAGRYAESAGANHYRSAAKVVRGWLKRGVLSRSL